MAPANLLAQDYWPRAFARAVDQVALHRHHPALWCRVLAAGLPRYLLDDRWVMLRRFASALIEDDALTRRVAGNLQARACAVSLLTEAARRDELRELSIAARATLDGAAANATPAAGAPGHVRVAVQMPRRGFVIEDLIVSTIADGERVDRDAERLARYATAAHAVDRVLTKRFHPWVALPGDAAAPVLDNVCLASSSNPIGRAEFPEEGQSLGLGLGVAAICHRLGWTLGHDRVVFTGALDPEVEPGALARIGRVERIVDKLEAVVAWLEREPGPPALIFIPAANAPEVPSLVERIEALGGRVYALATLAEVIHRLPIHSPPAAPAGRRAEWIAVGLAFLWWGERLIGGEYVPDPLAQASHGAAAYLAVSIGPALLPGLTMIALLRTQRGDAIQHSIVRILLLMFALFAATNVMFYIQNALGAFDFPGDRGRRTWCVYKDAVIVYSGTVALFILHPLQLRRLSSRAWPDRAAGQILGPRWQRSRRWAAEMPGWQTLVRTSIVVLSMAMMFMFAGDLIKAMSHNRWIAAHIAFQIMLPAAIGAVVVAACTVWPLADVVSVAGSHSEVSAA